MNRDEYRKKKVKENKKAATHIEKEKGGREYSTEKKVCGVGRECNSGRGTQCRLK